MLWVGLEVDNGNSAPNVVDLNRRQEVVKVDEAFDASPKNPERGITTDRGAGFPVW